LSCCVVSYNQSSSLLVSPLLQFSATLHLELVLKQTSKEAEQTWREREEKRRGEQEEEEEEQQME
jgi:hypothetical protein